jgi:hypothetical protein
MGFEFFRQYGGSRIRSYDSQPFMLDDGRMDAEEATEEEGLDFEMDPADWSKIDVSCKVIPTTWVLRPRRFIDGKHLGQVVTSLYSKDRYPVPVQLSQIGAIEMRDFDGMLRRVEETTERVVTLMAHLFPWDEIESLASALQRQGFRLLIAEKPRPLKEGAKAGYTFDYERMRKTTHNRSNDEMLRLEKQILARAPNVPTVLDGRLEPRASAFRNASVPTVGVIKTHHQNYLHPEGWHVFYDLSPRQRTPAFRITGRKSGDDNQPKKSSTLEVISWYLRLEGTQNDMPNYGIVRIEVPVYVGGTRFFSQKCSASDRDYIDNLSQILCDYRCRDESYGRAAVSIHPIQRAEESLGSLFTLSEALAGRFYYLTKL